MKILVVEDNVTDLKLILSILTRAGHEVCDAGSAEKAVALLKTTLPEVILTDLDLPCMDGVTMTRQLKQAAKTSDIPVIAMTSYPDHFSRSMMQQVGFASFLIKPLNTRTLSRELTDVIKQG